MFRKPHKSIDKAVKDGMLSNEAQIERELITSGDRVLTAVLCTLTCLGIPFAVCAVMSASKHYKKAVALQDQDKERKRAALAAQIGVVEPKRVSSQQMRDMPQEMAGPRPF